MNPSHVAIVIPARLHSTRLPRKLLLRHAGRSILEYTFRQAQRAQRAARIVVATGDAEIAEEAERIGAMVSWTNPLAASGTDRLAEVAARMEDIELFVNLQADEPGLPPEDLDQLIHDAWDDSAPIRTLAAPLSERARIEDPSCVKVVMDLRGQALYFSRAPIPHLRDGSEVPFPGPGPIYWQHLGVYAYRRDFLLQLGSLPPSRLEAAEKLEQLRFLEAGFPIHVTRVKFATRGIDTPEDFAEFARGASPSG